MCIRDRIIRLTHTGSGAQATSSGCRRRLPTLPTSRSPRNSIVPTDGPLISDVQHRQFVSDNLHMQQAARIPNEGRNQTPQQFGWIQCSFSLENSNLYVNVCAAQKLPMIEDDNSLSLPHPYAITRLCSTR